MTDYHKHKKIENPLEEPRIIFESENRIYVSDGVKLKKIVARNGNITSLASYDGKLYDSGIYGGPLYGGIYDTFSGKMIDNSTSVYSMTFDKEGRLYAANGRGIYEVFSQKFISDIKKLKKLLRLDDDDYEEDLDKICIATHDGNLYHGCMGEYGGKIYDTFLNKMIAKRKEGVNSLASNGEKLFDASDEKVYETFTNKVIVSGNGEILSLAVDDTKIYTGTPRGIHVFYRDGKEETLFPEIEGVYSIIIPDILTFQNALRSSQKMW